MNILNEPYPYRLLIGTTTASIGSFVAGCVYKQPEVAASGLAMSGVGILKLVTDFSDYIDIRSDLINEAIDIVTDAKTS